MGNRQCPMENVEMSVFYNDFWKGKKVFITGHTGFKGAWLSLWLNSLGVRVKGYALIPPTQPSLFEICNIKELITSVIGDVRDSEKLMQAMQEAQPDIVIHMAAQPIVRESYLLKMGSCLMN